MNDTDLNSELNSDSKLSMQTNKIDIAEGKSKFGLSRLVAIASPDNDASIRVLEKLGFAFEKMIRVTEGAAETKLFARAL